MLVMQGIHKCMHCHSLTSTKGPFYKLSKEPLLEWHQRKAVNSIIKLTFHTCCFQMEALNELSFPLFCPVPFNVFFLICSSNRHQLMLKQWTSEPSKRPSFWYIDETPGRESSRLSVFKDTTMIATETMASPRVSSIKHLSLKSRTKKQNVF